MRTFKPQSKKVTKSFANLSWVFLCFSYNHSAFAIAFALGVINSWCYAPLLSMGIGHIAQGFPTSPSLNQGYVLQSRASPGI